MHIKGPRQHPRQLPQRRCVRARARWLCSRNSVVGEEVASGKDAHGLAHLVEVVLGFKVLQAGHCDSKARSIPSPCFGGRRVPRRVKPGPTSGHKKTKGENRKVLS